MTNKLIAQGAEAKIYLTPEVRKITKDRIIKGYRHPKLDKQIRTRRTRSEAKIMLKAYKAKVNVPYLTHKDNRVSSAKLYMEYIDGNRLSETLNNYDKKIQFRIMKKLGGQVALLHENNLIHGDLTTSNVILKTNNRTPDTGHPKVYIIDFGLGFVSTKIEDKAVDIHLIKQALEAKHFRSPNHLRGQNHEDLFKEFCKGYKWEDSDKILERLEVVEKRGRYKH